METTREVSRSVQRGSCYEELLYHDTHLGEAAGLGFCITQQRVERESWSLSRKPLFGAKEQTRNESSFISYQSFLEHSRRAQGSAQPLSLEARGAVHGPTHEEH